MASRLATSLLLLFIYYNTISSAPTAASSNADYTNIPADNSTDSSPEDYWYDNATDLLPPLYMCKGYNLTGSNCWECYDGILIWPVTAAGEEATLPCPVIDEPIAGVARRMCMENGTWSSRADYSVCISHIQQAKETIKENEATMKYDIEVHKITSYIYLGGFALSNVAMITAIVIFFRFQHLRCMRNIIHCQLLTAITLKNFLWMALVTNTYYFDIFNKPLECKLIMTAYKFFQLAQFAWMFVEGLYLFLVIVRTFMTKMLALRHFILIGWGIPTVVTLTWIILNLTTTRSGEDVCWMSSEVLAPANALEILSIALLLMANTVFMMSVVHTLVGKLKNSALNETKQYRKAVKATVVLIPLLGVLYLLLFLAPNDSNRLVYTVWLYSNAVLQSTQGLTVACVYCFMNNEVRASIAKCQRRWRDERTLPSVSVSWWSSRRRSSSGITRREDTDTEVYNAASRRNSRRVSDEIGSTTRGSNNNIADVKTIPEHPGKLNVQEHGGGKLKSKDLKETKVLLSQANVVSEAIDVC